MKRFRLHAPLLALRQSDVTQPQFEPLLPGTCLVQAALPRQSELVEVQDATDDRLYTVFYSDLLERSDLVEAPTATQLRWLKP